MNIKIVTIVLLSVIAVFFVYKQAIALQPGDTAPVFTLADETGTMRTLEEFKGHKVVLFFYPKDDSPGCTKEACALRDAFAIYKDNNIVLLGVSYDSPASHAQFKKEHHLPFSLLSDSEKKVAAAYGANRAWLFNVMSKRKTFLIDEQGKLVTIFNEVNVKTHSDMVLKAFGIQA